MTESEQISKAELLDRIEESWNGLNTLVASLPETQLTTLKDENGWSIKDHVAHVASWESTVEMLLDRKEMAQALGVPADVWRSKDIDAINDVLHEQRVALTFEQAFDIFRTTHQRVFARLQATPEAEFHRQYNVFEPESERRYPVSLWIAGNTYEHYDEHREWIEKLINQAT